MGMSDLNERLNQARRYPEGFCHYIMISPDRIIKLVTEPEMLDFQVVFKCINFHTKSDIILIHIVQNCTYEF